MKLFGLKVIKHSAVPAEEAWIIRRNDSGELPSDLRGKLQVPCILTADVALLKRAMILTRLLNMGDVRTPKIGGPPAAALRPQQPPPPQPPQEQQQRRFRKTRARVRECRRRCSHHTTAAAAAAR